jgi:hypothetical protein
MKILAIFLLLFSFGILRNMHKFGYDPNDAFWRVVWSIDEGTIWAPGFSEANFSKIKLTMHKEEVLKLVGRPLSNIDDCDDICTWAYTRQDAGTSDFDQRWVDFDNNNRVSGIRKSFFID